MRNPKVGERVMWFVDNVPKAVALGHPATKKGIVTKVYRGELSIEVKEEGKRKPISITKYDLASVGDWDYGKE